MSNETLAIVELVLAFINIGIGIRLRNTFVCILSFAVAGLLLGFSIEYFILYAQEISLLMTK